MVLKLQFDMRDIGVIILFWNNLERIGHILVEHGVHLVRDVNIYALIKRMIMMNKIQMSMESISLILDVTLLSKVIWLRMEGYMNMGVIIIYFIMGDKSEWGNNAQWCFGTDVSRSKSESVAI